MEMIWAKAILMGIVLMICSYFDIKEKKVPLICILAGSAGVLVLDVIGKDNVLACMIGATLGAVLVVMSKVTKNAIGLGDALLVVMIGLGMGIYQTSLVVFYGLFITAVICAVLLAMKRIKKTTKVPFVPFLLMGYVGVILSW